LAPSRKEDVRPIFWSHRPKSYLQRTATWDEFPNGRWGDARSPAYGDLTDYHLAALHVTKDSGERKEAWGENVKSLQDVNNVFAKYCSGEVKRLPWCDQPLSPESDLIKDNLIKMNKCGFLTINSQPAINGVSSSDERFGWGPKGGFVYQKAYVEFYASPDLIKVLLGVMKQYPSLTYHAVNLKGDSFANSEHNTNAVTWGVFPGKEIVQPTVVSTDSFLVWKDEAFALWKSQWESLYEEGSVSRQVISTIMSSYLMNIVDNNFITGDIFAIFNNVIKEVEKN